LNRLGCVALALAACLLLPAAIVRANVDTATGPVQVTIEECVSLRAIEVQRLTLLELANATGDAEITGLEVQVTCTEGRIRISVSDPLTQKQLARTIERPHNESGLERILALSASSLFLVSWSELLMEGTRFEQSSSEASPVASDMLAGAADAAENAIGDTGLTLHLTVVGTAQARHIGDAFVTYGGGLRVAIGPRDSGWQLLGELTLETGNVDRRAGDIAIRGGRATAGARYALFTVGTTFEVGVAGVTGVGVTSLSGTPNDANVIGSTTDGWTVDAGIEIEPTLQIGDARIGIAGQALAGWSSVNGLVSDDSSVSPAGVSLALHVHVGMRL